MSDIEAVLAGEGILDTTNITVKVHRVEGGMSSPLAHAGTARLAAMLISVGAGDPALRALS